MSYICSPILEIPQFKSHSFSFKFFMILKMQILLEGVFYSLDEEFIILGRRLQNWQALESRLWWGMGVEGWEGRVEGKQLSYQRVCQGCTWRHQVWRWRCSPLCRHCWIPGKPNYCLEPYRSGNIGLSGPFLCPWVSRVQSRLLPPPVLTLQWGEEKGTRVSRCLTTESHLLTPSD